MGNDESKEGNLSDLEGEINPDDVQSQGGGRPRKDEAAGANRKGTTPDAANA